jgi:light-regulated signal transduction histidine kinase (bacteriophytochrome)
MIDMMSVDPSFLQNQVVAEVSHYHSQYLRQVGVEAPMWLLVLKAMPRGIVAFGAIGLFVWVFSHL